MQNISKLNTFLHKSAGLLQFTTCYQLFLRDYQSALHVWCILTFFSDAFLRHLKVLLLHERKGKVWEKCLIKKKHIQFRAHKNAKLMAEKV